MLGDSEKPLVLYGEGGCGKTSLLAKSASLCIEWFKGDRPLTIVRFLGTTPDSSALTPTLISICQQVRGRYKRRIYIFIRILIIIFRYRTTL